MKIARGDERDMGGEIKKSLTSKRCSAKIWRRIVVAQSAARRRLAVIGGVSVIIIGIVPKKETQWKS